MTERPEFCCDAAPFDQFLGALQTAGIKPEDVDVVVNTHLHTDHVGWNTHRLNGSWLPTFPNARYLMPDADCRHFAPRRPGFDRRDAIVFSDSILPVADQTELIAGDYQLSDSLWLRPAAGHTRVDGGLAGRRCAGGVRR